MNINICDVFFWNGKHDRAVGMCIEQRFLQNEMEKEYLIYWSDNHLLWYEKKHIIESIAEGKMSYHSINNAK